MMGFYFLRGATLGLSATMMPGPFLAFLLSQTLKTGWKRTLPATMAPLISDGPIIALVLLILTQTPNWLLNSIQIVGGLFILYLARDSFLVMQNPPVIPINSTEATTQSIFKATLMNVLNPNPYIFWSLVAGPILLEGWRQSPSLGISFLIGFYGTLVGGFACLVILFATASHLDSRANKVLAGISAFALLIFGFYQLWSGLTILFGTTL